MNAEQTADLSVDDQENLIDPMTSPEGVVAPIPVKEFTELSSMALNIITILAGSQLRVDDPDTIDTAYELIDAMSQDAKESILAHYDFMCDVQDELNR